MSVHTYIAITHTVHSEMLTLFTSSSLPIVPFCTLNPFVPFCNFLLKLGCRVVGKQSSTDYNIHA